MTENIEFTSGRWVCPVVDINPEGNVGTTLCNTPKLCEISGCQMFGGSAGPIMELASSNDEPDFIDPDR